MTHSLQMAVCDAIAAALRAGTALCDGGVHDDDATPMAEQYTGQIFVVWDDSNWSNASLAGQPSDWITMVRVGCAARGTTGYSATTGRRAADALFAQAYARVLADRSLGGLAMDVQPTAVAMRTAEADTTVAIVHTVFKVWHRGPADTVAAA